MVPALASLNWALVWPFWFDIDVAPAAGRTSEQSADLFECRSLGQEADRYAPHVTAIMAGGFHRLDAFGEHVGDHDRAWFGLSGHCCSESRRSRPLGGLKRYYRNRRRMLPAIARELAVMTTAVATMFQRMARAIGLAARWRPALSLAVPNRRPILNSSAVAGRPTHFP